MNRLFYNRVYLCGPIDNAKDFGVGWRNDIQDTLEHLDLIFLDPCNKPMQMEQACEDIENHQRREELKKARDFEALAREMREIRCIDLRMADLCDFAIVHLDTSVYSTGSHEEIAMLNRRKVPILIHMEQGKAGLPDWYWGTVPHQHVFSTWGEMVAYIESVARGPGPVKTFNRWRFLDYGSLYGKRTIDAVNASTGAQVQVQVSPEDHRYLSQWEWTLTARRGGWQVMNLTDSGWGRTMRQEVAAQLRLGVKDHGLEHVDGDPLNNTRGNIKAIK